MNKRKLNLIKKIISYDDSVEFHRRVLNKIKKRYKSLPVKEKAKLIEEIKKQFNPE